MQTNPLLPSYDTAVPDRMPAHKQEQREQINADIAEFLARGGQLTVVPGYVYRPPERLGGWREHKDKDYKIKADELAGRRKPGECWCGKPTRKKRTTCGNPACIKHGMSFGRGKMTRRTGALLFNK